MQPTAILRAQLLVLCAGDDHESGRLAAELTALSEAIVAAVPSTVSVTLGLVRDGVELSVAISSCAGARQPVLSSLAGPLPAAEPGAVLIVRAADAGVFAARYGHPKPWLGLDTAHVQVDQHLAPALLEPGASLAAALSELQSVQQGLGALIEAGLVPLAARAELARRADGAGTTLAAVIEVLLGDIPPAGHADDL